MLSERFLSHVQKTSTCWLWTGSTGSNGYGMMSINGKTVRSHRISYTIYKGDIPSGYVIDHLCRIRNCVNPEYLEAVTPRENVLRGVGIPAMNSKKTRCVHGHIYTKQNTIIKVNGARNCRTCINLLKKKYRLQRQLSK